MTNPTQPPFYVPKERAEPRWYGKPIAIAAVALASISVVVQPFTSRAANFTPGQETAWVGQSTRAPVFLGGKVPTKLWRWDHVPTPDWVGQALPAPKFLGGQVTTKLWQWDHVPTPSWIGQAIPASGFLGPQAPTKLWRWDYFDEKDWIGQAVRPPVFLGGQVPTKLWSWNFDPAPAWAWKSPPPSSLYYTIVTAPFYGSTVDFLTVPTETNLWQGKSTAKPIFLGGQVPTKRWSYDRAEDFFWNGRSISPPQFLGGRPPPRLAWNFGAPLDTAWQFSPAQPKPPQVTRTTPFAPTQWAFSLDVPAFWVGHPTAIYSANIPAPPAGLLPPQRTLMGTGV